MHEDFELLATSPFAALVGPVFVRWVPGPVFRVEVRPETTNTMGSAHGGFLSAVVDIAGGQGTRRLLADGRAIVTATTTIDFRRPVRVGEWIDATVQLLDDAGSTIRTRCRLCVGDREVAVATLSFAVPSKG